MAAPTIYRWDDTDAPSLAGGSERVKGLAEVLEKCLVTGYGSKAAAGWSKQFDDAGFNRVFRPASEEFGLRVNDTGTTNTALFCADAWTDAVTAASPGYWEQGVTRYFARSNSTVSTTHRPWIVIASPNRCIVIACQSSTSWASSSIATNCSIMAVGKYVPLRTGMGLTNTLVASHTTTDPVYVALSVIRAFTTGTSPLCYAVVQRGAFGGVDAYDQAAEPMCIQFGNISGSGYNAAYDFSGRVGYNVDVNVVDPELQVLDFMLVNYRGHILGAVPGIQALACYVSPANYFQTVTIEGTDYLMLCTGGSTTATSQSYHLINAYSEWP